MSKDIELDYQFTSDPTWVPAGALDKIRNFAYSRNFTLEEVLETVTASEVAWDAVVNYR